MTDLFEATDAFARALIERTWAPGVSIAIARGGEVVWEQCYGVADLNRKDPVTPSTVFRSGSMGKTYVATAVMQLVERGLMGLHDPVNKHLDFEIVNPLGDRDVTIHDLLTHRTGLAGNGANSHLVPPIPLDEHLRDIYTREHNDYYHGSLMPFWTHKPGENYFYSNIGMATLGRLVELTDPEDRSFSDYVQQEIIDPLGMTSVQYPPASDPSQARHDLMDRLTTGYAGFTSAMLPTPAIYFADWPAGWVLLTPGDHIKLALAYATGGGGILKPETVELMLTPQYDHVDDNGDAHGLVWKLRHWDTPGRAFGHGGAHMFGWHSDFRVFPELDTAVAVSTNFWPITGLGLTHDLTTFVGKFVAGEELPEAAGPPSPQRGWQTSYVMGVDMAAQLDGMLGLPEPVTPEMVDAMARGAHSRVAGLFEPDAFRSGALDCLARRPLTKDALQSFLASDACRVSSDDFLPILTSLGGAGMFYAFMAQTFG